MPGCVLRASGDHFDAQAFLRESLFVPCNVFQKGTPKSLSRWWTTSGFTVVVSEASGDDLEHQIQDALEFLRVHKEEIARLISFEALDAVDLDFGVNRKDGFLQSSYLPSELIRLASALGVGIEISIYGSDES
jgi:hypothetical protein